MFKVLMIAAANSAAALPAAAATVVATLTGTVSSGGDFTGVFLSDGADPEALAGEVFTLTYTIDTGVGLYDNNHGFNESVRGGDAFGVESPVSAVLEINGVAQAIMGDRLGLASATITVTQYYASQGEVDFSQPAYFDYKEVIVTINDLAGSLRWT